MLRNLLIIILSLFVTGCGFHLRGHEPLPPHLHLLYLQVNAPYSALSKELHQILCSNGVQLAPYAGAAPVTLQILSDTFGQSITSVGSSQQVTTYFLTYTVTYQLNDAEGHAIMCPQTIVANRSYSIASNQILADTSTLFSLQEDMRQDVIFQLLNRLRAPATIRALNQIC